MPPKKSDKKAQPPTPPPDSKRETPMQYDFKYDPKRMAPVQSHKDWINLSKLSSLCSEAVVGHMMEGVHQHIQGKLISQMTVPFITEAGLSITLEPSLLFYYTPDDGSFEVDLDEEMKEPHAQSLDWYCPDKAKLVKEETTISESVSTAEKPKRKVSSPSGRSRKGMHGQRRMSRLLSLHQSVAHVVGKQPEDSITSPPSRKKVSILEQPTNIPLFPASPEEMSVNLHHAGPPKFGEPQPRIAMSNVRHQSPHYSESIGSPTKRRMTLNDVEMFHNLPDAFSPDFQVDVKQLDYEPIYQTIDHATAQEDDLLRKQMEGRPGMDRSRQESQKKIGNKWDLAKNLTDKQIEQGMLLPPKKGTALVQGEDGLQVVHDLTQEDKNRISKALLHEREADVMHFQLLAEEPKPKKELQRRTSKLGKAALLSHLKEDIENQIAQNLKSHDSKQSIKPGPSEDDMTKSPFHTASKATPLPLKDSAVSGRHPRALEMQHSHLKDLHTKKQGTENERKTTQQDKEDNDDEQSLKEEDEVNFDATYLNALNESIIISTPEKLRAKESELFDVTAKVKGLNTSVFSSASDFMEQIKPNNGVKISNKKMELGHPAFINPNASKMTLKEYKDIARKNSSLASIALRGISEIRKTDESEKSPKFQPVKHVHQTKSGHLATFALGFKNRDLSKKSGKSIDFKHMDKLDDDFNNRVFDNSMRDSWRIFRNTSESPKESANPKSRKFVPQSMRSIDKININLPSEKGESNGKIKKIGLSQSIDYTTMLVDKDFKVKTKRPILDTDFSALQTLPTHRMDTDPGADFILFNDQRQLFEAYRSSRDPVKVKPFRQVDSPVSKYKAETSLEKKSIFKLKDKVDNSPRDRKLKLTSMVSKKNVIDRLRLSQKMLELRELKKKNYVDGSKDLHPDDGDHGIKEGFIKRNGLEHASSALQQLLQESPSKQMKPPMNSTISHFQRKLRLRGNLTTMGGTTQNFPMTTKAQSSELDLDSALRENSSVFESTKAGDSRQLYPNPPTGFKKVVLPSLRDRNRQLLSEKISIQNSHVNRSLRRYIN